jgi:hypothetical protein
LRLLGHGRQTTPQAVFHFFGVSTPGGSRFFAWLALLPSTTEQPHPPTATTVPSALVLMA